MRDLVQASPLPKHRARAARASGVWLLLALGVAALLPAPLAAADTSSQCYPSALVDLLPKVVAPMAGQEPIWLVGASLLRWGDGAPVRTAWVLDKSYEGPLVVTGQRKRSPSQLGFLESDGRTVATVLEIADPHSQSIVPGGADEITRKRYSFVMTDMVFPTPGCWEIEARLGREVAQVVVWVPDGARH